VRRLDIFLRVFNYFQSGLLELLFFSFSSEIVCYNTHELDAKVQIYLIISQQSY
jgi:hypothetical protein